MAEFKFAVAETGFDKLFGLLLTKLPATAKPSAPHSHCAFGARSGVHAGSAPPASRAGFTPSSQNIYTIYIQCLLKLWDSPKILQLLDTNSVK